MRYLVRIHLLVTAAAGLVSTHRAVAQVPTDRQFEIVLSFLPPEAQEGARLVVPSDSGYEVYREGGNQFECRGDRPGDARFSLTCYHTSLAPFLAYQQTITGLRGTAFREKLCADVAAGAVDVPEHAYMLDISGALSTAGELPDSVTVYHMLQLPYATEESTGITDVELTPGSPWLHHAGTCDAHIMWSERHALP